MVEKRTTENHVCQVDEDEHNYRVLNERQQILQKEVQFELHAERQKFVTDSSDLVKYDDFSIGFEDFQDIVRNGSANIRSESMSYEEMPLPCCRVDVASYIVRCNQLFADLVGCPRDQILQSNLLDLVDSSSSSLVEGILPSAGVDKVELSSVDSQTIWLKKKDQNVTFPAIISVKPLKDSRGRTIAYNVALTDQTAQHKKIEEVEKIKSDLKRKERLKDEFVTVASHELRTPIQPILGYALLAKKGLISEQEAWDGILQQGRELQRLANEILDVSKIDSGNLQLSFSREKVHHLLELVVKSFKKELDDGEVILSLAYDESQANLQAEIDRSRFIQVISSVLATSVRFAQRGSILVTSKVRPIENKIEIRVSDTGKGISEEMLPTLFEKFATKGHGDASSNKGTGLGLYISRAIIKLHNGHITAFNNKEGGATFTILLPISQAEQAMVDAEQMNMKGMNLVRNHQLREALECFEYALNLNPNSSRAWYNKGMSLFRLGESKEDALLCFQKSLELDPLDAEAWNNKGALLAILGNHKEALTCYIRALELRPGYGKAWQNKGLLLSKIGDKKGAKDCFRNAIDSTLP